jgi:hypothetical protein
VTVTVIMSCSAYSASLLAALHLVSDTRCRAVWPGPKASAGGGRG